MSKRVDTPIWSATGADNTGAASTVQHDLVYNMI